MASQDCAGGFGENLRRCRRRAGVSQEELGSRSSLHRTEVGLLERGVRTPRIDTLIKLAYALEVDPGELLAGIDWMPEETEVVTRRAAGFSVKPVGSTPAVQQ
ncbi:MAG TPA: helix-turn-helix transcriptional regulator [Solirubrobacterales bacterium]|nr:helix-turn-helix transcriptional regulator [Solirubrobacterales bacterium]